MIHCAKCGRTPFGSCAACRGEAEAEAEWVGLMVNPLEIGDKEVTDNIRPIHPNALTAARDAMREDHEKARAEALCSGDLYSFMGAFDVEPTRAFFVIRKGPTVETDEAAFYSQHEGKIILGPVERIDGLADAKVAILHLCPSVMEVTIRVLED